MTCKYNSVSSEDFGSLKFPWKKVQHSESGWHAHDLRYMVVVTSSSPPWRLINFFLKVDYQRRDFSSGYCHKITFFQSLARFICLKRLLLRALDVDIAKLCNIWFLSFVRELPPWKVEAGPQRFFTPLKIGSQGLHVATLDGNNWVKLFVLIGWP